MRWSSVAVALASAKSFAVALDPVSVVGNKFFNKDGSQFFIKGTSLWRRGEGNGKMAEA